MTTFALTGADSIIINNLPVKDFANDDIGNLEVPNNLFELATGKNGNTIFALDESGRNATLTLRILIGSSDDRRFNGLIPDIGNFASTVLCDGSVVKSVGDGTGNIHYVSFLLAGGAIQKIPSTKVNVNGDVSQAVVEYVFNFATVTRSIL